MRDSANDAFFTAESLENLSEALVREAIQNSLDAAERGGSGERQVGVRILFVPKADQLTAQMVHSLFEAKAAHFEKALGVSSIQNLFAEGSGYIVMEDFGTKGLNGDVSEWRQERIGDNGFFSFFRAEGRSSKSGESLGRWGIGKQVFPTSSRIHSIFGLTIRRDQPQKVLMGSAVLRTHTVNGDDYHPDAWYGHWDDSAKQVMPIHDDKAIAQFASAFGLKRQDETGLSVIVPCVDDRVNLDELRRGIIRNFFWPILSGDLTVNLESPGQSWVIDAENIRGHTSLLPQSEAAVVEFASWAAFAKPESIVILPRESALRPDWSATRAGLLPETIVKNIRAHLESTQRVGLKIPVRVRPKNGVSEGKWSHFLVFIESSLDAGFRTLFLRDGILIKDVRATSLPRCRSLVVCDDGPLAGLLGDAEGVNHTQWQKDSPKFHNRYVYGPQTISFVRQSVAEIVQAVHSRDVKGDPNLLIDLFYLPSGEGPEGTRRSPDTKKGGEVSPPLQKPPEAKPKKFDLRPADGGGGFVLRPGKLKLEKFPVKVLVEAAYAVRRGNPVKRWSPDDFVLIRDPLKEGPKAKGLYVSRTDGNKVELSISKPDFEFGVYGFDKKRDLVVRAIELRSDDHEENI